MSKFVIGLDFGTNSCRALIIDILDGKEVACHIFNYLSGSHGVILDNNDPELARQNPQDYIDGIEITIRESIRKAKDTDSTFDSLQIIGIGVDTTGSSPLPVDENGMPLCFQEKFNNNPAAMVWLWKDHTSHEEAVLITKLASEIRPQFLSKIGGVYSSEWFWSKIIHCAKVSPDVFNSAYSFVEICDWIPAILTGTQKPSQIKRSICAAGHKAIYNDIWGGLPDKEFLEILHPGSGSLRDRLYDKAFSAEQKAGTLSKEWADRLCLSPDTVVAVGAFDAHMGAVGAGIDTGTIVKIIGTSTCDIMVYPDDQPLADIKGVCGIVKGSVMSGFYGIEAGQSAVGDIFLWFVRNFVPETYGKTIDEKFINLEKAASKLHAGESGLIALDWNNGNRTILVDTRLSGLILGQTLHTTPHEIYLSLIESTAFGALTIIERIQQYGVPLSQVVNCGGLAVKSPLLMQVYADIIGLPMNVSRSEQTPALGAGIFASVAAGKSVGGYTTVAEAINAMTGIHKTYYPDPEKQSTYKSVYCLYKQLHDAFGTSDWSGKMNNIMKELLIIRDKVRENIHA